MITNEIIEKMLERGIYYFGTDVYVRSNGDFALNSNVQSSNGNYYAEDYKVGNINNYSEKELEELLEDAFYYAFNAFLKGEEQPSKSSTVMTKMSKDDKKNKVNDSHYISIRYMHNAMHQNMKIVDMQRDGNNWYASKSVPGVEFKGNNTFKDVVKEFKKILVSNKR